MPPAMAASSKRESAQTFSPLLADFIAKADALAAVCQKVKGTPSRLRSHPFYAAKGRSALAELRRSYERLVAGHPADSVPSLKAHFEQLKAQMDLVVASYPGDVPKLAKALKEIGLVASTELSIELRSLGAPPTPVVAREFIPDELLDGHESTLKKILWEMNVCYENKCYNAAAVLARRLVESLLILTFEAKGIGSRIKDGDGNYFMLKGLIAATGGSPELKLGRTVKDGLPKSKFFGDLGAHNPRALVRKADLDAAHELIRVAIEELAGMSRPGRPSP
jgi:hypothetical protein